MAEEERKLSLSCWIQHSQPVLPLNLSYEIINSFAVDSDLSSLVCYLLAKTSQLIRSFPQHRLSAVALSSLHRPCVSIVPSCGVIFLFLCLCLAYKVYASSPSSPWCSLSLLRASKKQLNQEYWLSPSMCKDESESCEQGRCGSHGPHNSLWCEWGTQLGARQDLE